MTTSHPDQTNTSYQQSLDNIRGYLTFQLMSKPYISSFDLIGINGSQVQMGDALTGDESIWNQIAQAKEGESVWSNTYSLHMGVNETKKVISLTRVINDIDQINHPIGRVRIRLDSDKLNHLIATPSLINKGSIFLTNKEGQVLIESGHPLHVSTDVIKKLERDQTNKASFSTKLGGQNYSTLTRPVTGTDWILLDVVNQNQIDHSLNHIRQLMRFLIILLIVLGLFGFLAYYYFNIKRIIDLMETTRQVENRNFKVKVKVRVRDEIGKLGLRFNKMVETIQDYIDREYRLKIEQKESELKALQNQMDPHFLYNTLDMIRWKARIEKAEETSHLIELLSKVFRNSLKSGTLFTTIKDEQTFLESYLDLQKKRIGESFHYQIQVDHPLEKAFILKQLLQPIVENAIKHGMKDKQGPKEIHIHFSIEGNFLIIDGIDNGVGMDPETFNAAILRNEGHALKNLQDRLVLAFGKDYGLELKPLEHSGTWIRVKMPLIFDRTQIQKRYQDNGD